MEPCSASAQSPGCPSSNPCNISETIPETHQVGAPMGSKSERSVPAPALLRGWHPNIEAQNEHRMGIPHLSTPNLGIEWDAGELPPNLSHPHNQAEWEAWGPPSSIPNPCPSSIGSMCLSDIQSLPKGAVRMHFLCSECLCTWPCMWCPCVCAIYIHGHVYGVCMEHWSAALEGLYGHFIPEEDQVQK